MINKKVKIRVQLTIAIFLASLIVLIASASVFIYYESEHTKENIRNVADSVVKILVHDFLSASVLKNPDAAVDMANKMQAFDAIQFAIFIDSNNTPVLVYHHPDADKSLAIRLMNSDTVNLEKYELFLISNEISHSGKEYGMAYLYFSSKPFKQQFLGVLYQFFIYIPLLLIFSAFIAFYFQRFFSRPIQELSEAMDSFANDSNSPVPLGRTNILELDRIFRNFVRMRQMIKKSQDTLAEQKERLHITLESIADGVIATDEQGRVTYMNPVAESITGWSEKESLSRPASDIYQLVDDDTEKSLVGYIDESLLSGSVNFRLEHTSLYTREKKKVAVQSSISPISGENNKVLGVVIVFQDISKARELAQKLQHQAAHDPLTGLYNRAEFEQLLLSKMLSTQNNARHALLYLDLDQFKIVNDTSGHTAGDALLVQVSTLLSNQVRDTDFVARLGGDEFAIFLPQCSINQAGEIAEKIRMAISDFVFVWEEQHFKIGVSIGVVPIDGTIKSSDELLRAADLACYAAKDLGRNRIHIYHENDEMLTQRHGEMHWANELGHAVQQDKLLLYAQHIRPLNENNPTEHLELLVRFRGDDGVISLPGAFLPAAERYGIAPSLDRWVIQYALNNSMLIDFMKKNRNFRININLSGLTMSDPEIVNFVRNNLEHASLEPRSICFEITETAAVANLASTSHFMRTMKLLGCEFALDDFGVGVSSFTYLKNLPIDYLKIDGSFIKDLDKNSINMAMVNAINEIGHVMNVQTVAEFVHSKNVYHEIKKLGIDFAQGYFIHQPCPLDEVYNELHKKIQIADNF